MYNIFFRLKSLLLAGGEDVVSPLYEGITVIGPYAISVVLVLSIFYGIFLGVKFAKSESPDEKANVQKVLTNFLIGAAIVLVLLLVLYAIRGPIVKLIDS